MKSIRILLMASITLFSCNTHKPATESNNANSKLITDYFNTFNQHNWTKMAAMYTDTADFKDPSLGTEIVKQTRQQTIDKYSELSKLFPDIHDSITAIYPSDDQHIVVEFISTGTAQDFSKFKLPICTIFTIENGFITKDFTYYDNK